MVGVLIYSPVHMGKNPLHHLYLGYGGQAQLVDVTILNSIVKQGPCPVTTGSVELYNVLEVPLVFVDNYDSHFPP